MQQNFIPCLPRRWADFLSAPIADKSRRDKRHEIIWQLQNDNEHLLITATPEQIAVQAEQMARLCYALCDQVRTVDAILDAVRELCAKKNVAINEDAKPRDIIARAIDAIWWNRQLRKEVARRLEHNAIRLGLTGLRSGPYISTESALQQIDRNRRNAKLMANKTLVNEYGQEYALDALSDLGVSNKKIRLGELMTRMRGMEEIADDMGHVAMFWTITCPSKYHAVGGTNAKYNDATPRDAQAYLVRVWAAIRAAFQRAGVRCYGIRIAEPHTDGCPHWHMMLFVDREKEQAMNAIITAYALAEDGDEAGAKKNRVKLVRIEHDKGSAAGYIIKYISKNVAGEGVGEHKTRDGYTIATDLFDGIELTPSDRVTCWSQRWGIRQFQQIGGAPVGVWRELRRIKMEAVQQAPQVIQDALRAVQKIESDDPAIAKQADFAAYIRAQGGPFVGRMGAVQIAKKITLVEGRYATREEERPCGVYALHRPHEVYESVRYRWTEKEKKGVDFALPWTGVNNYTRSEWCEDAIKKMIDEKIKIFSADYVAEWKEVRKNDEGIEINHDTLKNMDNDRVNRLRDYVKIAYERGNMRKWELKKEAEIRKSTMKRLNHDYETVKAKIESTPGWNER